ncbi:MAG: ribosomal-protein-alanine N-acetyltransferase [Calditrichaeota bacterium]|nr:MAG: ribosomal-protein-alanine N-acetyltransferase [Calditrichota bacterium]
MTTSIPNIRPMREEDLDTVLGIEEKVFLEPWSRRSYMFEIYSNRYSIPVVLEVDNQIIGHAVVWRLFEEFHIATIAIAPEHQGKGWGKFLMNALLGMSDAAEYAILEVRKSNHRAIRLYEKLGFKVTGVRHRYYQNGEDALVMRKDLIP